MLRITGGNDKQGFPMKQVSGTFQFLFVFVSIYQAVIKIKILNRIVNFLFLSCKLSVSVTVC